MLNITFTITISYSKEGVLLFHLRNAVLNRLIEILNLSGIRLVHELGVQHEICCCKVVRNRNIIYYCDRNKEVLQGHFLCGTGTTARLIAEKTGLPVKGYCSGPLGGDQQIGAKIVEGQIDFMIFLWDPLEEMSL